MAAASNCCHIQTLYVLVFTKAMGTHLFSLGVTMVLLTTTPLGRLLHAPASIIHESHQVTLLVLPCRIFMELARIQIASWVLPTCTWPKTDPKPGLGSPFMTSELISEAFTLMDYELGWLAD